MALNIIHVSNLSLNGTWFERLLLAMHKRSISQSLVTLSSSEVIFSSGIPEDLQIYSPKCNFRIFRYIEVINLIRIAKTKGEPNFLFAQGHEESIISSIAARIFGMEFGLVHHMQPSFFPELMQKKLLRGFIHNQLYEYYITRASLIQSLSMDVTERLTRLGVHSNKIVCLAHGINFEEFAEKITESKLPPRKFDNFPILLMVGRLSWEKNYPLALESFRKLTSEFKNAKLLIAGIGPMDIQLREMVNQYNLDQEVEFLGYVSNIPGLMIEADALLHLSLSESYGQIYVEACLADLPIISYPVGIVKELKDMNIPEITILNSKDPAVIATNIASLCENTLKGRKKHGFDPQPYAIHDERFVLQSIAKYLQDFGQRAI
jgi:glycosyltransferase involved in cell wall biosynthesis